MSILPKSPGIYIITCLPTGKIYVGSSVNIQKRCYEHFRTLKHQQHRNSYLQRAYNKYGAQAFKAEVLELVMPWNLIDRENYWLSKLKPFERDIGFNIGIKAEASTYGRKHSPETRAKLGVNKGRVFSAETRAKVSAAGKGRRQTSKQKQAVADANSKRCVVIAPNGVEMEVFNLSKFCKANGLDNSAMARVARGKSSHHKGWKCRYV